MIDTAYEYGQKGLSFYHNSRIGQMDGETDILLMTKTAVHRCSAVKITETESRLDSQYKLLLLMDHSHRVVFFCFWHI